MEFDINRVYTAVNADELKVGSKVYVADTIKIIKVMVKNNSAEIETIERIEPEDGVARFFDGYTHWCLAYLVSEQEEKKLKWTDLKIGDVIRNKELPFIKHLITGIDEGAGQVFFCGSWTKDSELEEWEKVEE